MNMKKTISVIVIVISQQFLWAQQKLPLALYSNADTTRPLIFYISGDGGFNKFSTALMETLNKAGYAVIGLNAKDYFWNRKKPEVAARAIEGTIDETNKLWKRKNIVLIGYSFGADVAPFMITHFSAGLSGKLTGLILLSPSTKTDFEIHVLQMLGWNKDSGESVPDEVNKIIIPVTVITGDDENEFPFDKLKNKNKQLIRMKGGHHYDGDVETLSKRIARQIR